MPHRYPTSNNRGKQVERPVSPINQMSLQDEFKLAGSSAPRETLYQTRENFSPRPSESNELLLDAIKLLTQTISETRDTQAADFRRLEHTLNERFSNLESNLRSNVEPSRSPSTATRVKVEPSRNKSLIDASSQDAEDEDSEPLEAPRASSNVHFPTTNLRTSIEDLRNRREDIRTSLLTRQANRSPLTRQDARADLSYGSRSPVELRSNPFERLRTPSNLRMTSEPPRRFDTTVETFDAPVRRNYPKPETLPSFDGSFEANHRQWINKVDAILAYGNTTEGYIVSQLPVMLRDSANDWYFMRIQEGEAPVSWNEWRFDICQHWETDDWRARVQRFIEGYRFPSSESDPSTYCSTYFNWARAQNPHKSIHEIMLDILSKSPPMLAFVIRPSITADMRFSEFTNAFSLIARPLNTSGRVLETPVSSRSSNSNLRNKVEGISNLRSGSEPSSNLRQHGSKPRTSSNPSSEDSNKPQDSKSITNEERKKSYHAPKVKHLPECYKCGLPGYARECPDHAQRIGINAVTEDKKTETKKLCYVCGDDKHDASFHNTSINAVSVEDEQAQEYARACEQEEADRDEMLFNI